MNLRLRISAIVPLALLLCGVALLGCPGTLAEKECFVQEARAVKILTQSCIDKTCHNSSEAVVGLDLETAGISERLKGKKALTCDGNLIEPGDPAKSILFAKLQDPPPCGSRMPLAKAELFPEEIEILRTWITGLDGSCSNGGSGGGMAGSAGSSGAAGSSGTSGAAGSSGGASGAAGSGGMGGMSGSAGTGGSSGGTGGAGGT